MGQQPLNAPVESTGTTTASTPQQNSTTLPSVSQNLKPLDRIVNPNAQRSLTSRIVSGSALAQNAQGAAPAARASAPVETPRQETSGASEASAAAAAAAHGPQNSGSAAPTEKKGFVEGFVSGAATEVKGMFTETSIKWGFGLGAAGAVLAWIGFAPAVVTTLTVAGGLYAAKGVWDFLQADKNKPEGYGKAVAEILIGGTPLVALGNKSLAGGRVVETIFAPRKALEVRAALNATNLETVATHVRGSGALVSETLTNLNAATANAVGAPARSLAHRSVAALEQAATTSVELLETQVGHANRVRVEAARPLGRFELAAQSYRDYLKLEADKAKVANSTARGRLVSIARSAVGWGFVAASVYVLHDLWTGDTEGTKNGINKVIGLFGRVKDYFTGNPKVEAVNTPTQASIDMSSQSLAAITDPNGAPAARPGAASSLTANTGLVAPQTQVSDVSNIISRDADPVMRNLLYAARQTMKEESQRLIGGNSSENYFHPSALSLMHPGQRQWNSATEYDPAKDVQVSRAILADLRRDPSNDGDAVVIFTKYFGRDQRLGQKAAEKFAAFQGGR